MRILTSSFLFFFNDTATTEIYTLSLHDALPISTPVDEQRLDRGRLAQEPLEDLADPCRIVFLDDHVSHLRHLAPFPPSPDRKSTRLNSSHGYISYAVFCLKKKKK